MSAATHPRFAWVCVAAIFFFGFFGGCVDDDADVDQIVQAVSVGSYVDSDVCSSAVVLDLSVQIAGEVQCMMPGLLVPFAEGDGIVFTGTVLPWMGPEARADLRAAAAEGELQVNSAYRTVAQQYLLRAWFEAGRCGITAAALPGESNHESGRAVDLANWADRVDVMAAHGWDQTVPGDEVHFDHLASPDIRGTDVHAFQRLWNRNHPEELIDEDGSWGPMTEDALARSPAEGFPMGPDCEPLDPDDPGLDPGGGGGGDPGDAVGGCSAGGGGGGSAGFALVLVLLAAFSLKRSRV